MRNDAAARERLRELSNGTSGVLGADYMGLTAVGVFTGKSIGRANVQFDPIFFKLPG